MESWEIIMKYKDVQTCRGRLVDHAARSIFEFSVTIGEYLRFYVGPSFHIIMAILSCKIDTLSL